MPDQPPDATAEPLDGTYWTSSRKKILQFLRDHSPHLAELYHGAVDLLYASKPPGLGRFVAHAVREIRNRLPDAIPGVVGTRHGNRVDVHRLDRLAVSWREHGPALGLLDALSREDGDGLVTIPLALASEIDQALMDYGEGRKSRQDKVAEMFAVQSGQERAGGADLAVLAKHWLDITEWAEETRHVGRPCLEGPELEEKFEIFERTLSGLLGYFFEAVDDLDEILDRANS